ncbi:helix-turn-helix domain-containing protein [Bacillus sp. 1P06AnD]|uniref:helix-turn-helix domain-containing protein n=1 Tax=Bacillus sp. 1P06AnD TaxID=3132208 RepID=UPI0039A26AA3
MTEFGIKVIIRLNDLGLSRRKFAQELKISDAYLSDILKGKRKALKQKKRIAEVLDIPFYEEKDVM